MNALVFLYKRVLKKQLDGAINAIRATKKVNVPVVMTREETAKVISMMGGTTQLAVKLMYGSGLRISETIRLRMQDIDYNMKTITVRSGKGARDRITTFPSSIIPFLQDHPAQVKIMRPVRLSFKLCKSREKLYSPQRSQRTQREMIFFLPLGASKGP